MKLNQAKKSLESSGMTVNVDFSIDMNSKAFSVVTEGIYSDIVGTIVRELSSNAYDSHVEAGKANVPFEVSCPTHFDPFFAVKDFGTGLRYFSYTGTIENIVEGESTITIDGDIRSDVRGIDTIILGQAEIAKINADRLLYDTNNDVTVIRVIGDREDGQIQIEFDDTLVLYSTYFRSTKEQSNDYIGAFGLGSKTPLAYTDNFIVTNRFNGVERTYNILTNEDNKPQISLMNSTTTDDSNGLEIKLAVDPDDYTSFKDAIQKQLKYFDPLPEIQNETINFPKVLYKGKHIIVCDELPVSGWDAYVCVGNNAYQVNGNRVTSSIFKNYHTALRFNVGDVMVTASRESLKDDEQNNRAIAEKNNKAVEEYKNYVFDQLEADSMTEMEKALFINTQSEVIKFTNDEVVSFIGNPHYQYNSYTSKVYLPLSIWGSYDCIDIIDDQTTVSQRRVVKGERKHPLSWFKYSRYNEKVDTQINDVSYNLDPNTMPVIFVKDASYAFLKKINHYLKEVDDTGMWNDGNKPIYVVSYKDKDAAENSLDAIREVLGSAVKIIYLSEIELPKADPADRGYENNTPVCRRLGQLHYRVHSPLEWNDEFTPLTRIDNTNAYAVPIDRNTVEFSRTKMELLKKAMSSKDKEIDLGLNIDFESIEIYGIPKAKYEKAISYGFTPLEKLIDKIEDQIRLPRKVVNRHYLKNLSEAIDELRVIAILKTLEENFVFDNLEDNDVKKLLRVSRIYDNRYGNVTEMEEFSDYIEVPECPENIKKLVDSVSKIRYNVQRSLVLFEDISTYRLHRDELKQKALIDYINYAMKTEIQEN